MAVLRLQLCTVVSAFLCSFRLWALKLQTDVSSLDNEETGTNTVTLRNSHNIQYSGDFTIGGQTLPVIYDTGSFEVLALSTRCTGCAPRLSQYNESLSHSFKVGQKMGSHQYVSGSIITQEGFDDLNLGSVGSHYVAKNMTFWMVTSHSMSFWSNGKSIFSGIVGLSHVNRLPEAYSVDEGDPRSLLTEMGINAFSLCLCRSSSAHQEAPPGYLRFGVNVHHEMEKHPGAFQSADVVGDAHWSTTLTGLEIDGMDTQRFCKPHCSALIDSGTSLLAFPVSLKPITDRLTLQIKSDCSNIDDLPVLSFKVGGAQVLLPPKAYVFKATKDGKPVCKGGFMHINKKSDFGEVFMLGMPFLRYYHTIFDRKNSKLHFARSTSKCGISKASWFLTSNQIELARKKAYQPQISVFGSIKHDGEKQQKHQQLDELARIANLEGTGLEQDDFSEPTLGDIDDAILPMWAIDGPEKVKL